MIKQSKAIKKYQNRLEKHSFISKYLFSSFSHSQSILINSGELLHDKTIKTTTDVPKSLRKTHFFSNYLFSKYSNLQSILINSGELLNDKTI